MFRLLTHLTQIEQRAVEAILRSKKFHEGVGYIHKSVQNAKEGKLPEKPQLMDLERANQGRFGEFMQHFRQELRDQIKGVNPLRKK